MGNKSRKKWLGKGKTNLKKESEKWITHYSSSHSILLVGEEDFSFAASLGRAFGIAANMVATSPHSRDVLRKKFSKVIANLNELEELDCKVIHCVDAKTIAQCSVLNKYSFDRIVYNFPHAGPFESESSDRQNKSHQKLVKYFLRSAHQLLTEEGEVHITHRTGHPFRKWEMQQLGIEAGLRMFRQVPFFIHKYPGYMNKRGTGTRCNESFPLGECSTYMFRKFHQ